MSRSENAKCNVILIKFHKFFIEMKKMLIKNLLKNFNAVCFLCYHIIKWRSIYFAQKMAF